MGKGHMRDDYSRGAMPLTMAAAQGEVAQGVPVGNSAWPAAQPPLAGAVDGYKPGYPTMGAAAQPQEVGPTVDGKQFFRQARNNLSYEAFNEFLTNIKKLNNQQQTREETLDEARRIFGTELQHLFKEFEQLLNRHSM